MAGPEPWGRRNETARFHQRHRGFCSGHLVASRARATSGTSTPYRRAHAFRLRTNPEAQARLAAFMQGMRDAGWEHSANNPRIEYRWSVGDRARLSADATELVALGPDAILAGVGATTECAATRDP